MNTKKICSSIFIILAITSIAKAQLYVDSRGAATVGSVVGPPIQATLQVVGSAIFPTITGLSNSCAYIRGGNGYSNRLIPDYTFWYNDQCGIYHPAQDNIGFTVQGNEIVNLSPGVMFVYGWTFTRSLWIYSDSGLKENVKTIPGALSKVLKLRGVTFTYNDQKTEDTNTKSPLPSGLQMGLIAQEVERVVPEVVHTDKGGLKAIEYQNLVGLLIEAIKQEDKKVSDLQNRLDSCCNLNQSETQGQNPNNTNGVNNNQSMLSGQALLYQNVPNPFNQQTSIQYFIPTDATSASILILNMEGVLIKTNAINSFGNGTLTINGGDLKPGMYLYTLIVNNQEVGTKKMILTN